MDTSVLKYFAFIKTVEYGRFTKAAEVLHYSQSGISRMIHDLESEWGVVLFGTKPRWGALIGRWSAFAVLCQRSMPGL